MYLGICHNKSDFRIGRGVCVKKGGLLELNKKLRILISLRFILFIGIYNMNDNTLMVYDSVFFVRLIEFSKQNFG